MPSRKTLVTGGAGFIGSHLTERLLYDGHSVRVIDNLASGKLENLDSVKNHPKLDIHVADVANHEGIKPFFEDVDWVFHLAGIADVVPSIQEPLRYHQANVDGTVAVLEAARNAGVSRLVYAASSSCYGLPDEVPTPETADMRPMYPYALSKNLGEQCVMHWNRVYQLPCVSLRLFNVYGPRSRTSGSYGAVFGVFLAQKMAGKPFTIVGDGNQSRDFVFVTDVADAFVRAADSDVAGEALNIGSGGTYSINSLVGILGGEAVHLPKRPGEPDSTFADISKIQQLLGWQPQVEFEDGVQVMLRQIELWKNAPVWDPDSISGVTKDWFKYLGDNPSVQPAVTNEQRNQ